jgi:hypothetical protein
VRLPFSTMVANGWRRQNMLGDYHFEQGTGQLTEAARLKIRWILTAGPEQHRLIYVHIADNDPETSARVMAVQQLASQISPANLPPVLTTSISDEGWSASQVDVIERRYLGSQPSPRLAPTTSPGGAGGGGN